MNIKLLTGFLFTLLTLLGTPVRAQPSADSPKLEIINGSNQVIDLFWLKSESERIANGSAEPGRSTSIRTTLGHRFEMIGRTDQAAAKVTCEARIQGFRFDPAAVDGVPKFYSQIASANGFPICASANVNPYAVKEAVTIVNQMLSNRPDVRAAMIRSGARLCIMSYQEFTTDLPEFAHLADERSPGGDGSSAKDFWDARARGTGGSETDPFCSCAEENVLCYPGDPYSTECILIHEFAHCIHLRGMLNVDPTFDKRLRSAYDSAMKAGLWKGKYASVNHHEYFAEGVQSWFDNNRSDDHDHNHVDTRSELIEYDPGLAEMCREVFGETVLKYTKPTTRLTGHMSGYDPKGAPTFVWPKRLTQAKTEIRKKAQQRDRSANDKSPYVTQNVSGWTVHVRRELLESGSAKTETDRAMKLLEVQLNEIVHVVPANAVVELKKVPLWISPEYPATPPRAEYHPGAGWLRDNNRDPAMAKGVEFTNVRIFEAETRRMPNFALHELAHAFHDRVLPKGFDNSELKAAYDVAKKSGKYDRVERQDSEGRKRMDVAYALTNPQEYFAENTEAYFTKNDFFPFDRKELREHDPETLTLIAKLWGAESE
jgi:hypothetical protein